MILARPFRRRRGAILLQVSFLLLVLMGLAAVVIDLGIVRATQIQMQASVDPAAIEGLRYRDADIDDSNTNDVLRRLRSSLVASTVFDDDVDPSTPDESGLYGAGPIFSTGVVGIDSPAGGLLETAGPYRPVLQDNFDGNAVFGDLVAGNYFAVNPSFDGDPSWHVEGTGYGRRDFLAAPAGDPAAADAFLVRHRRTRPGAPLDRVPGVSSAGPTVPFLFGLGSGVLTSDAPDVYDPRRDGVTVRAVAIAGARPALAAGLARDGLRGIAVLGRNASDSGISHVLALDEVLWTTGLAPGAPFAVQVDSAGNLTGVIGGASPSLTGSAGGAVGWLRVGGLPYEGLPTTPTLGTIVLGTALLTPGVHHVALVGAEPSDPTDPRIVGFGAVEITSATLGTTPAGDPLLTIAGRKLPRSVAVENASAVPSLAFDVRRLASDVTERALLLAPVLVR